MNYRNLAIILVICLLLAGGFASNTLAMETTIGAPIKMPQVSVFSAGPDAPALLNLRIYLPTLFNFEITPNLPWVDTQNREAVRQYYLNDYLSSDGVSASWTGSHNSCNPGTTSAAFREAVLNRINYFRAMTGVPGISGLKTEFNQKAQAAALMMSVNARLSHDPETSWECYSNDGNEAAGKSNLYLGVYGPAAISGYIYDPGSGNYPAGHRRWILYPQTKYMGTGDIPSVSGERPSNTLWVIEPDTIWGQRPETRDPFVAWPPKGYVPRQVVYPRWSFSYPSADFSSTSISITRNNQNIGVSISPIVNGYGENTVVWELDEALHSGDTVYNVTLQNVKINNVFQNFTYQVKIFDPTQ